MALAFIYLQMTDLEARHGYNLRHEGGIHLDRRFETQIVHSVTYPATNTAGSF